MAHLSGELRGRGQVAERVKSGEVHAAFDTVSSGLAVIL